MLPEAKQLRLPGVWLGDDTIWLSLVISWKCFSWILLWFYLPLLNISHSTVSLFHLSHLFASLQEMFPGGKPVMYPALWSWTASFQASLLMIFRQELLEWLHKTSRGSLLLGWLNPDSALQADVYLSIMIFRKLMFHLVYLIFSMNLSVFHSLFPLSFVVHRAAFLSLTAFFLALSSSISDDIFPLLHAASFSAFYL